HPGDEDEAQDNADDVGHDVEERVEAEGDFTLSSAASDHGFHTRLAATQRGARHSLNARLRWLLRRPRARGSARFSVRQERPASDRPGDTSGPHRHGPGNALRGGTAHRRAAPSPACGRSIVARIAATDYCLMRGPTPTPV